MNFDFLQKRWFARVVVSVAIIILITTLLVWPNFFSNYSSLILVIVTIFYVLFTYEILRTTKESRAMPYVSAEFIIVNKFSPQFLAKYERFLKKSERFQQLQREAQRGTLNKDIVFLKGENIGSVNAIDVICKLSYEKNNIGEISNLSKNINFGVIKKGQYNIDLIEVYDNPGQRDYFKVQSCLMEFNDVNSKYAKEKSKKEDFSKSSQVTTEKGVSTNFIPKE